MSEGFKETLQAYSDVSNNPGLNTEDFFYRLALKTGIISSLVGMRPVWANNDKYPHDIHLAYLYFSSISTNYSQTILSWHTVKGLDESQLRLKHSIEIYVRSIAGIPSKYIVNIDTVNTIWKRLRFTDNEWSQLYKIVEDVMKHFGVL